MTKSRAELIAGASLYGELVGGLGDAILRLYFTGRAWYEPLTNLGGAEYAVFTLMSHNPYLSEVFSWHPNKNRIKLIDLGFHTPFHPWESKEWRLRNGLSGEAPCPPHAPSETLQFYPSKSDLKFLERLRSAGPYVVLSATAGDPQKSIPNETRVDISKIIASSGRQCLVVGRSMYLYREGNAPESVASPWIVNATDQLSVPGTIEAVKGAVGVVSADTSILHAAWQEHRPVFLLYNQWTVENLIPMGPVGYMQGIDRRDTDHMEFGDYTDDRFRRWLTARR